MCFQFGSNRGYQLVPILHQKFRFLFSDFSWYSHTWSCSNAHVHWQANWCRVCFSHFRRCCSLLSSVSPQRNFPLKWSTCVLIIWKVEIPRFFIHGLYTISAVENYIRLPWNSKVVSEGRLDLININKKSPFRDCLICLPQPINGLGYGPVFRRMQPEAIFSFFGNNCYYRK